MSKIKLATIWLDGCSGCHMSVLDMDEAILAVAEKVDIVYGPLVDAQAIPEGIDVALVEGAVSSQEDLKKLQQLRSRSRILIALGDCAVTGNVPAMRNGIPVAKLLQRVYVEGAQANARVPVQGVPPLLAQARPLRDYVKVDYHLPGCPPKPDLILGVLGDLLNGKAPKLPPVKFG